MYDDVMALFRDEDVLPYFPLRIHFVNERAVDCGGVCRDMLSGFWEEALGQHFDGSSLLTPVIHAQTNMSDFIVLGTILSHGYLLEGYLPVRVSYLSLAKMLLGPVAVPENMLASSFADSLSTVESQLIKSCLTLSSNNF